MDRIRRRGRVEDRALTRKNVPAVMLSGPNDGQPVTPDAALLIADVYACIRALADTAASLPLVAYRRTADGRDRFNGRLADLLAQPSPGATTANVVGTLVAHLNAHGNAFLGKYRDDRGVVVQLAPLDPRSITVRVEGGDPVYELYRPDGVTRHDASDMLHIRALSTDGVTGLSPIAQARQALGLAQSLAGHADSFARNAGRPGGVLALKGAAADTDDERRREFKANFTDRFPIEKSGSVMVLAGDGVDYQQLALSMADAEFVAQRQLSTAEIARVFRVPPWVIGAPSGDSMTYANVAEQARAFVVFSLAPWLTLIEQAITADSDLSPRSVYVEFLLDGLLRGDAESRSRVYQAALDPERGWMRRDEVRRAENLPPERGDQSPKPKEGIA